MLTRRIRVLISYPLILATGARGGISDRRLSRKANGGFFLPIVGGSLYADPPRPGPPRAQCPPAAPPVPAMRLPGLAGRCRRRVAQRQAGKMAPGCQLPLPPNPRRTTLALGLLDQPKHTTTWPKFSRRSAAAWPLATATHGPRAAKQKPSKTPGERPAKTPGNARETRKHSAKRQEAGRSGCRAFHFGAGGSAATGRGDGTTGRRRGTCCCS